MTNKEFYGEKLLAIALEENCHKLHKAVYGESCMGSEKCKDCEFYNVESIENWLNAEHKEPPLLENGDGLKPGDRIMVRDQDDQTWAKCTFICYLDGRFWITPTEGPYLLGQLLISGWKQACLPMEGE